MKITKAYLKSLRDVEIKQLVKVVKTEQCPVNRCQDCLIDLTINCIDGRLTTDQILEQCKDIVNKLPKEKLFDIVL